MRLVFVRPHRWLLHSQTPSESEPAACWAPQQSLMVSSALISTQDMSAVYACFAWPFVSGHETARDSGRVRVVA